MSYYATGNKAGKLLAHRVKGLRYKTKIPYIIHPLSNSKLYHPQDIDDSFSHYFSTLYNLKDDADTYQPIPDAISQFLQNVNIPTIPKNNYKN